MKYSIVIPARNEAGSIASTVNALVDAFALEQIDYEIVVIDDASTDDTYEIVEALANDNPRIRPYRSPNTPGFGLAIRAGFDVFSGDAVAIVMADESDSPTDAVRYLRVLEDGWDCAFGSRFVRGATVSDYPRTKLVLNRIVNGGIRMLFRHGYNDTTNAFKAYRREVIETLQPLLSNQFNLTVELPLKAIARAITSRSFRSPGRTAPAAPRSSACRRWAVVTCSSSSTCGWRGRCPAATISASQKRAA